MADAAISVNNDSAHSRYVVQIDGRAVGFAAYRVAPGQVVFTHTVIDPDVSGHGVGSALAGAALDDVRRQGKKVVALCPFIAAFIGQHTEYADLLAE